MITQQVHDYLKTFFNETNCEIINQSNYYLTVQLTIDIDKKIMNRPFYWQYIEATNGTPYPAQLTLITDQNNAPENMRGEIIHFGSMRLKQLFKATKELGGIVQMYENVYTQSTLTPYFGVNYKVSYYCDQTKESIYSFGINLLTGSIYEDFQETLGALDLVTDIPKSAFSIQPIIKPNRALERLDATIEKLIKEDDHSWAEEAKNRWQKEQKILDYFYEGVENKPESYETEKKAIEERFNPRINVEIINGGIFYLSSF